MLVMVSGVLLAYVGSTVSHLSIPDGSGQLAVGRQSVILVDDSRAETHTADPFDKRSVPLQIWYPAIEGTGRAAEYIDGLDTIDDGLVASGELGWLEVLGLRWVRDPALAEAAISAGENVYPLILLSPGNATNVGFYATLAEDLASRGYVVVGVDHAYQVTATRVADGSVAVYDPIGDASPDGVGPRIDERVADLGFVLDQFMQDHPDLKRIAEHIDLDRIGAMGHSNGGLAAVNLCRDGSTLSACLNIDGQAAWGPFGYEIGASAPDQPFLYLTKETDIHPELNQVFETSTQPAVRVVIPEAEHGDFSDGAMFVPTPNPIPGPASRVLHTSREFVAAFFDNWLKSPKNEPYADLDVRSDVYVNIYPLDRKEPIPSG